MEQNQNRQRRHYSPDQKFKIIKEQMTSKSSVSEICKKYDISPNQEHLDQYQHGFDEARNSLGIHQLFHCNDQLRERKIL